MPFPEASKGKTKILHFKLSFSIIVGFKKKFAFLKSYFSSMMEELTGLEATINS